MKFNFDVFLKGLMFEANQREELIQRAAWRLVRSASDRMGEQKGNSKMLWAIAELQKEFPDLGGRAEDYVRAAYVNFKTETRV